ncbi:MAG TPA: GTPase RsgA, partial [Telluria sp.]|nr:GTPase RsgA [Telluria sp.]
MSELTGTIIAAHGRHYLADVAGRKLQCVTRGKKTNVAVGDLVHLKMTSDDQAVIEAIAERKTLLYRSDQYKSKLLAANLTRLFIVVATEPGFADDLISRSLVAAEAAGIEAHLILNKTDVAALLPKARERLRAYTSLGYPLHEVSARAAPEHAVATLMPLLAGQSSIFIGQSGMGKSSLINLLVPDA